MQDSSQTQHPDVQQPVPADSNDAQQHAAQTPPAEAQDNTLAMQIAMAEQRGYMRALGINPAPEGVPSILADFNPTSFWD